MHDLSSLPERVRGVVEEYCRRRCAEADREAFARGLAAGRDEVLTTFKVLAAVRGDAVQLPPVPVPVPLPTVMAVAPEQSEPKDKKDRKPIQVPIPEDLLSVGGPAAGGLLAMADGDGDGDDIGTAGFRDALDDLFGDERWGDLDRQELVRYVMLLVQEELAARGVDPTPVLGMVRTLAECGGGEPYEQALLSMADPEQLAVHLSWQAVPLKHPRGNFRFAAENLETGQKRYGDKAIDHMRHANRDRYEFPEEGRQAYDAKGERTLAEHTEAFRKAKDSLADLVEALRAGRSVRPGDLVDFQDRIGLLAVPDLRTLRKQLATSLTGRVKAGKTKADRVAGIRQSLARLTEAAAAITKAALLQAERGGVVTHPPEEMLETVIEGLLEDILPPGEANLSAAPNSPPKAVGKKAEVPKPAAPKAGAYPAAPPKAAPKPPAATKPAAPPKAPAYSDYGVGGQKMEGVTPGRKTVAEVQQQSAEKAEPRANMPAPKAGQPQDVPRPTRPSSQPMERTTAAKVPPAAVAPKPDLRNLDETPGKLHPAEQQEIDSENADFMTPESRAAFQARLDEYQGERAYDWFDAAAVAGTAVDQASGEWDTFAEGPNGPAWGGREVKGPFKPDGLVQPEERFGYAERVPTEAGRRGMAKRIAMGLTGNADQGKRSLFERAWADADAGRRDSPAVVELMRMPDDGRPETALAKQLVSAGFSPEDLGNAFSAWNRTFGWSNGMNAMYGQFVPPAGAAEAQASEDVRGLIGAYRNTGDRSVLPVLADAYEEAGVPAEDLYVLRDRPDLIRDGMWAVTPPEAEADDQVLMSVESPAGGSRGHKPPAGVVAAAKRILKLKEEKGGDVRGGTSVGWARARQLASGGPVSDDVVKRMANFFSRHAKNFAVTPEHKGEPWKDHGWTAFMLWGGDPGRSWSTALAKRLRGDADLSVPAQEPARKPIRIRRFLGN